MRASEFIVERKKRRKKSKSRWAAYGPGPYGGYGYYAGYSGDSGEGSGDGGGESVNRGVAEGVPQPGPSSGAPKKFGPDAKIETGRMTVKQIISSIPGVPYYNNVVDDWDAKDYSWGVTKKVIEYATYLKDHPESLEKLPPILVLNGKFEDGAHRVSAIWLLQQRMDPKNPLWANAKLNVQFVKQGVAEGWRDGVASAALAGAMALGGAGAAQAGDDNTNAGWRNLPDIVAHITMKVNGNTIEKEINLGTEYQSPMAAKEAVAKWLKEKGITNYTINLERIKPKVDENFADGKNPQDKGDSKRHGINTKASVSSLRKTAKQGGRKGQLAHWLANMKSGKKK